MTGISQARNSEVDAGNDFRCSGKSMNICRPCSLASPAGRCACTMPLPASVQCRSPARISRLASVLSRLCIAPVLSSSNSVAALMPACGCGPKAGPVITKWSTITSGDMPREKSVWRNCRMVHESPGDLMEPAKAALR
ncbi:hypothetical protein D3C72_2010480 [compost metagenome]